MGSTGFSLLHLVAKSLFPQQGRMQVLSKTLLEIAAVAASTLLNNWASPQQFFLFFWKAPRRILEEDATVRLSFYSYTIANNQTQIHQSNPTYERAFPLDLEYHQPATLLHKLPELSQSAEDSGNQSPEVRYLFFYYFPHLWACASFQCLTNLLWLQCSTNPGT